MGPPPIGLLRRKPASMLFLLLIILVFFNTHGLSQSVIEYLPGFPHKLPFKLETGYIGVGENEEVQIFYYFIESERNPEDYPLMLWHTGGPGCTVLSGMTNNIGPLIFNFANSDGSLPTLMLNEYSWTKGLDFLMHKLQKLTIHTYSAALNYEFLRKWLISHPIYIENPLYIGGDSYSGMIVPLVVNEVYNGIEAGSKPLLNMKGYVLGNPHTDQDIDINGRIPYAHGMGLLSYGLYKSAKKNCRGNYLNVDSENVICLSDLEKMNQCLNKINFDEILEPSCEPLWKEKQHVLSWQIPSYDQENPMSYIQSIVAPLPKCRISISSYNQPVTGHIPTDSTVPQESRNYVFAFYKRFHTWANNKSVQKALHIRQGTVTEWVRCNGTIRDSPISPDGTMPYIKNIQSTVSYHKDFIRKSYRALIFSGDHDMTIPHTSTEKWIDSLNLPILSDWRPWFVDSQVAGYTMTYRHGDYELTYATVKGAGHVAPEYKPEQCTAMISRWFEKSSL